MQLRWHFLKDLVHSGLIKIEKVPTTANISDVLTKAVPKQTLQRCLSGAGSWKVPSVDEIGEINLIWQEETTSTTFPVVKYNKKESLMATPTPWMLVIMFAIGFVSAIWLMRKLTCTPRRSTVTRTVGTQSQVTYTSLAGHIAPRFTPLPEDRQGDFEPGGLHLR